MVKVALGGELLFGGFEPGVDRLEESVPRALEPTPQGLGSGGAMKIWTESGFAARTWRAPWTSISSTTEWPASSRRSTSERSVP